MTSSRNVVNSEVFDLKDLHFDEKLSQISTNTFDNFENIDLPKLLSEYRKQVESNTPASADKIESLENGIRSKLAALWLNTAERTGIDNPEVIVDPKNYDLGKYLKNTLNTLSKEEAVSNAEFGISEQHLSQENLLKLATAVDAKYGISKIKEENKAPDGLGILTKHPVLSRVATLIAATYPCYYAVSTVNNYVASGINNYIVPALNKYFLSSQGYSNSLKSMVAIAATTAVLYKIVKWRNNVFKQKTVHLNTNQQSIETLINADPEYASKIAQNQTWLNKNLKNLSHIEKAFKAIGVTACLVGAGIITTGLTKFISQGIFNVNNLDGSLFNFLKQSVDTVFATGLITYGLSKAATYFDKNIFNRTKDYILELPKFLPKFKEFALKSLVLTPTLCALCVNVADIIIKPFEKLLTNSFFEGLTYGITLTGGILLLKPIAKLLAKRSNSKLIKSVAEKSWKETLKSALVRGIATTGVVALIGSTGFLFTSIVQSQLIIALAVTAVNLSANFIGNFRKNFPIIKTFLKRSDPSLKKEFSRGISFKEIKTAYGLIESAIRGESHRNGKILELVGFKYPYEKNSAKFISILKNYTQSAIVGLRGNLNVLEPKDLPEPIVDAINAVGRISSDLLFSSVMEVLGHDHKKRNASNLEDQETNGVFSFTYFLDDMREEYVAVLFKTFEAARVTPNENFINFISEESEFLMEFRQEKDNLTSREYTFLKLTKLYLENRSELDQTKELIEAIDTFLELKLEDTAKGSEAIEEDPIIIDEEEFEEEKKVIQEEKEEEKKKEEVKLNKKLNRTAEDDIEFIDAKLYELGFNQAKNIASSLIVARSQAILKTPDVYLASLIDLMSVYSFTDENIGGLKEIIDELDKLHNERLESTKFKNLSIKNYSESIEALMNKAIEQDILSNLINNEQKSSANKFFNSLPKSTRDNLIDRVKIPATKDEVIDKVHVWRLKIVHPYNLNRKEMQDIIESAATYQERFDSLFGKILSNINEYYIREEGSVSEDRRKEIANSVFVFVEDRIKQTIDYVYSIEESEEKKDFLKKLEIFKNYNKNEQVTSKIDPEVTSKESDKPKQKPLTTEWLTDNISVSREDRGEKGIHYVFKLKKENISLAISEKIMLEKAKQSNFQEFVKEALENEAFMKALESFINKATKK